LTIPPLRIEDRGQTFLSRAEISIDLSALVPGQYLIVAVQNFHVEDRNPNLSESATGIFLAARRTDGRWSEPETYPIECRALMVLGLIEFDLDAQPRLHPAP
jgi:hypothetical protein